MNIGYVLVILAVALTGIGQVLMKAGSTAAGGNWMRRYINVRVILALLLLLAATVLSVRAYETLPVSAVLFLLPLTYLWVGFLSRVLLKERIQRKQYLGVAIIVAGMVAYNL